MRIVNEILLKIWEKPKEDQFFLKVFEFWKNLLKIRDKLCTRTLLKIWDLLN